MPDPVTHEIILFEHAKFRGAHRHVFQREPDLDATAAGAAATHGTAGGRFAGKTSSIVVVKGTWILSEKKDLATPRHEVGPGRYDNVLDDLHIAHNSSIVSLEPKPGS